MDGIGWRDRNHRREWRHDGSGSRFVEFDRSPTSGDKKTSKSGCRWQVESLQGPL